MTAAADAYVKRIREVLYHIDTHLDESLTLERLSNVAAFSKYHFHRQFSELLGIGAHKYVQLVRLKRACYQLAFRDHQRITDIALGSGYESPEAFSRAFKKALGQTPSEFRAQPEWNAWHASYEDLRKVRTRHMKTAHTASDVKIVHFEATRVAALEHRGDPRRLEDSVRRFIEWRKQNKLPPKLSATFNITYDSPDGTPPEDYRCDLCAATEREILPNPFGVVSKTIPAGRCAVLRHIGSDDTLGASIAYLYSAWLPASGEELRDFPLFFQRVRFFPDVPEREALVDIFLPLA